MNDWHSRMNFPCVRNCCLDNDDICLGCFRALHEITGWNEADEAERRTILERSEQRREAHRLKWNKGPPISRR